MASCTGQKNCKPPKFYNGNSHETRRINRAYKKRDTNWLLKKEKNNTFRCKPGHSNLKTLGSYPQKYGSRLSSGVVLNNHFPVENIWEIPKETSMIKFFSKITGRYTKYNLWQPSLKVALNFKVFWIITFNIDFILSNKLLYSFRKQKVCQP